MIKQNIVIIDRIAGVDDKLSSNLLLSEIQCKCFRKDCIYTLVSPRVVDSFQILRNFAGVPLAINSGFRCKEHNKSVGGVTKSKHTYGLAIDISLAGFTDNYKPTLIEYAKSLFDVVIHYETLNFIHCHVEKSRNNL